MKVDLAEDLKDIDLRLCMEINVSYIVQSLYKNFSQTNNYAKGS